MVRNPDLLLVVALAISLTACARGARGGALMNCEPPSGPASGQFNVSNLAGRFQVVLVREGDDQRSDGVLTLHMRPDVASSTPRGGNARIALVGSTDLEVESVGGYLAGTAAATDEASPGVAVVADSTSVTLRLGSEANRQDRSAIDAAYFAMFVHEAGPGGFRGTWASGVEAKRVQGYFCATLMSDQ